MNKREVVYDIETLKSCFTYTDIDINTNEINQFVIHKDKNELITFLIYLNTLGLQIGFNNLDFDYPILHYIINHGILWDCISGEGVANLIYTETQRVINTENKFEINIPFWKYHIKQLDLYKILHYDNMNKRTSLKWIEFSIDMPNVQDMPIGHAEDNITLNQIQEILDYNLNDVKATLELYKIVIGNTELKLYKGVDKIQLRKDLIQEFNVKEHWLNFNDVKIGDEINKITYLRLKGIDKRDFKKTQTIRSKILIKDCVSPDIKFEIPEFVEFYNKFTKLEVNPKEKDLKTKGDSINYRYLNISFGFGGLHTVDSRRNIILKVDETLIDADVTSFYPQKIINDNLFPEHLDKEWIQGYKWIFDKRVQAKKEGKKSINEAYKLALNGGGYGKLNEITSWQYDPLQAFKVTIGNQFALLKLCEMFLLKGIFIVSLNTDGILCIVKDYQKQDYNEVCTKWQVLTSCKLEYNKYKRFIQTSVNDYLAQTIEDKFKYKGDWEIDKELHKNKSNTIRAIALKEHYINNAVPYDTISNHNNIFDFCIGRKKDRNQYYKYFYAEGFDLKEKILHDKVIRYYISTNGGKLHKIQGKKVTKMEQDYFITLYMNHTKKDMKEYNIDYRYYEVETLKIINTIEDFDLDIFLKNFKSFKQTKLFE
jgi:hypothetical protein